MQLENSLLERLGLDNACMSLVLDDTIHHQRGQGFRSAGARWADRFLAIGRDEFVSVQGEKIRFLSFLSFVWKKNTGRAVVPGLGPMLLSSILTRRLVVPLLCFRFLFTGLAVDIEGLDTSSAS